MRNKLFYSILVSIFAINTLASPIDQIKARFIAEQFLGQKLQKSGRPSLKQVTSQDSAMTAPPYYIFNAEDGGFVIISGDDTAKPVLGYSNNGSFGDDVPIQLQELLDSYRKEIETIPANTQSQAVNIKASTFEKVLPTANWNQSAPYNDLCPNSYPSGCVATAMATVMKYHNWPPQGTGSHSYTWNGETISYDFTRAYDWDNMLDEYIPNRYTDEQGNAVAELMKACGVSVEMYYSKNGSSASTSDAANSLFEHFKYDGSTQHVNMSDFTYEEWTNLIMSEIDNNRPIIYNGHGSESHSFICDGYNDNDMFHFNWGWGGSYNGFFTLTTLTPTEYDDFSQRNSMIVGIKPNYNQQIYSNVVFESDSGRGLQLDVENVVKGEYFNAFTGYLRENFDDSYGSFIYSIALVLVSEEGEIKEEIKSETYTHNPRYISILNPDFTGLKITTDINLTDCIQLVYKTSDGEYQKIREFINKPTSQPVSGNKASIAVINYSTNRPDITISGYTSGTKSKEYEQLSPILSSNYYISLSTPNDITRFVWEINGDTHYWNHTYYNTIISNDKYDIKIYGYTDSEAIYGKEYNVKTPGTLNELMTEAEANRLHDIKLTGTIDARDIYFMRDKMHLLKEIDMSEVTITEYEENEANHLPYHAFYQKEITSIILPANLTAFDNGALYNTDIEQIEIPKTVTSIGLNVFHSCHNLYTVVTYSAEPIPISWCVFAGTQQENSVLYVPVGSKEKYEATAYWNQFGQIIEDNNPDISVTSATIDNIVYTLIGKQATVIGYENNPTDIVIPSNITANGKNFTVTSIGSMAFFACKSLSSIILANTIIQIDVDAFSRCTNLSSITLPSKLEAICSSAFSSCYSLTSISIPASVTYIEDGNNPFHECYNLTSIAVDPANTVYDSRNNCNAIIKTKNNKLICGFQNTIIPSSVTHISDNAFSGQYLLSSISIPKWVTIIENFAFGSCIGLSSVKVHKTEPITLPNETFAGVDLESATLYVPEGCKELYETAEVWKEFGQIIEDGSLGAVENINIDTIVNGDAEYYNLNGVKVADGKLPTGLYIKRQNGKCTKIFVK